VLAHQDKPAEERNDEVLQDQREPGGGQANDRGHFVGSAEDNEQDAQRAKELDAEFEDDVQGVNAAAVEFRAIDEMAGECIQEDHADQNEGNQRERLQYHMQHNPMLQQYLRGPLAVNAHELLLALQAVATDAENLAQRRPALQAAEPLRPVEAGSGRGGGFDPVGKVGVLDREHSRIGLRLLQGLLD